MLNFVKAQATKIPLQQASSAAVMSVMQEARVVQTGTVNVSAVRTWVSSGISFLECFLLKCLNI